MTWNACTIPASEICWEPPTTLLCDPCLDLTDPVDRAAFDAAWEAASAFVYGQTCQRFPGDCFEERTRPCLRKCWCPPLSCGCGTYIAINLFDAFCLPVQEITAVQITGGDCCPCNTTETWTPTTGHYRLEWDGNCPILVRQRTTDEECCEWWPQQDLCRADGDQCSWSITARTGCPPPPDVLNATVALASDIAALCKTTACSLPQGVSRVVTRGVTFEKDPTSIGTGLWWEMLRELIAQYGCTPTTFERFVTPGGSPNQTSFHKVFGPRPIAAPVPAVTGG